MLVPDDLLTPLGRLNAAALWPKGGKSHPRGYDENTVEEKLQAFLTEGYGKVSGLAAEDQDAPVKAWSYHRAYQEVYERLLLMPSTVSVSDEGSSSYTQSQIEAMGVLAREALAEYEVFIDAAAGNTGSYAVIRSFR